MHGDNSTARALSIGNMIDSQDKYADTFREGYEMM